jgi:hypothetical protein
MGMTTFSGPVRSLAGFVGQVLPPAGGVAGPGIIFTAGPSAALPPPTVALTGAVMLVNDNGAGNNEFCLVICTGAAWVTATGQPLT